MAESTEPHPGSAIPPHSPGPWRIEPRRFTTDIFGPAGDLLAVAYAPAELDVQSQANAAVMAVAPDLLAELRRIVDYWTRPSLRLTEWEAEELKQAMRLIARAEGRSAE